MKDYMKENFGTKSGKIVLAVFFVLLIALSAGGALYVFYGDSLFGSSQSDVLPDTGDSGANTFVFTLKNKNISLKKGDSKTIKVEYDREEAKEIIEWTSSNAKVAHVDPNGRIVALSKGTVTVTATAGYYSSSCRVKVTGAEEKSKKSFSTAYTANKLALERNKADNSGRNLYYIKVNRLKNCVTVYTYDDKGKYTIPVRAMVCSCGQDNNTPAGEFAVSTRSSWLALYGNVYGQYVTQFYGDILFHSVPYEAQDASTVEVDEYNNLGKSISMGCVRLAAADAKWIYTNCNLGTIVEVYDGKKDGPLGTPPAMKINTKGSTSWDPTDDNVKNPFYKKSPSFKGAKNTAIDKGEYFDPLLGVTAADTCGGDITDRIKVAGEVNGDKPGEYILEYKVKDDMGRTSSKYRYITVK